MPIVAEDEWIIAVMSDAVSTQQRAHFVDREVLDTVGHELEAEHENAQATHHRDEHVLEIVDLHGRGFPYSLGLKYRARERRGSAPKTAVVDVTRRE